MADTKIETVLPGPAPWGFRIAGGRDFNQPITIARITPGSKAAHGNLLAGDNITRINGRVTDRMTHLEAQNTIKDSRDSLSLSLIRGESVIWKPKVTPTDTGNYNDPPFKVSLAANKQEPHNVGSQFNQSASPFSKGPGSATVVHTQYNTPVGLYSSDNISEAFRGQTQGIVSDVQLVGPSDSKQFDPSQSSTFKFLQEEQNRQPVRTQNQTQNDGYQGYGDPHQSRSFRMLQQETEEGPIKSVRAPETREGGYGTGGAGANSSPVCSDCNRAIVGPFVKVKEKNYHPECFKCTECKMSLRNKGYFEVDGKLYCETHVRRKASPPKQSVNLDRPVGGRPSYGGGGPTNYQPHADDSRHGNYPRSGYAGQGPHGQLSPGGYKQHSPGAAYHQQSPGAFKKPSTAVPHRPAPGSGSRPSFAGSSGGYQPPVSKTSYSGPSRPAPQPSRVSTGTKSQGGRIPVCVECHQNIRGPFVTALGKNWHPEHFKCSLCSCSLQDMGFVEEQGKLFCEQDYNDNFAPLCSKCHQRISSDVLHALEKTWHPDCFICVHCRRPFGNQGFHLEDGQPYCELDWNELFTTKCHCCGKAIQAGDRWVEALNESWHAHCFRCAKCDVPLEGQSFYARNGQPHCRAHAS